NEATDRYGCDEPTTREHGDPPNRMKDGERNCREFYNRRSALRFVTSADHRCPIVWVNSADQASCLERRRRGIPSWLHVSPTRRFLAGRVAFTPRDHQMVPATPSCRVPVNDRSDANLSP